MVDESPFRDGNGKVYIFWGGVFLALCVKKLFGGGRGDFAFGLAIVRDLLAMGGGTFPG